MKYKPVKCCLTQRDRTNAKIQLVRLPSVPLTHPSSPSPCLCQFLLTLLAIKKTADYMQWLGREITGRQKLTCFCPYQMMADMPLYCRVVVVVVLAAALYF